MKKILLTALMIGSVAGAAIIVLPPEVESIGPNTPNYSQTLTFNQFDPSLGTLQSILVTLSVDTSGGSLTVDNDGGDPASVVVELGAEGSISSTDVVLQTATFTPVVGDVSASTGDSFSLGVEDGDGTGNVDGSPLDGAVHPGGNDTANNSGNIGGLFFPGYTGLSTFDIDVQMDQILDFGSVGGVEGAFTPVTGGGTLSIQYTYDDGTIPEPASFALFGLLSLVFLRRRR